MLPCKFNFFHSSNLQIQFRLLLALILSTHVSLISLGKCRHILHTKTDVIFHRDSSLVFITNKDSNRDKKYKLCYRNVRPHTLKFQGENRYQFIELSNCVKKKNFSYKRFPHPSACNWILKCELFQYYAVHSRQTLILTESFIRVFPFCVE